MMKNSDCKEIRLKNLPYFKEISEILFTEYRGILKADYIKFYNLLIEKNLKELPENYSNNINEYHSDNLKLIDEVFSENDQISIYSVHFQKLNETIKVLLPTRRRRKLLY